MSREHLKLGFIGGLVGLAIYGTLGLFKDANKVREPDKPAFVLKQNILELEGYDATLEFGRELRVGRYIKKEKASESGFDSKVGVIYCEDLDKDGRPDTMNLLDVPKGSRLEKFASISLLSEVEQNLME